MWLLDANLDVHLVELLKGYEIDCDTERYLEAFARAWAAQPIRPRTGEIVVWP